MFTVAYPKIIELNFCKLSFSVTRANPSQPRVTSQSRVNKVKVLLILWHNRLPQQHYYQLKTPLILALSAYYSKTSSVFPSFYYRIVISIIGCNFLQSLKSFWEGGSEPPYIFENLRWLLTPFAESFQTLQKVASYLANYNSIIKNGGHRACF